MCVCVCVCVCVPFLYPDPSLSELLQAFHDIIEGQIEGKLLDIFNQKPNTALEIVPVRIVITIVIITSVIILTIKKNHEGKTPI